MIDDMPRPRPPHLHREVSRHGKPVWYVRVGKGPRIRLRSEYGTEEFQREYHAAVAGKPMVKAKAGATLGTFAWLYERYRDSANWRELSLATRRQRENIFSHVMETAGKQPIERITTAAIVASRDARKGTPAQARNFLDAMRGLFRWAKEAGFVKDDPTFGVSNPKRKKGAGFLMW
ncbi:MAG: integrase, partial [Acidobacteria bacterium]|nr:integrase [Acidobacteriota bacterium]